MKKIYLFLIISVLTLSARAQYCSYPNLLNNPGAESGLTGWTFTNGGSGWIAYAGGAYEGQNAFVASYAWCVKTQTVDLVTSGYTRAVLNTQPAITVKEQFRGSGPNTN
ncbi:MAG: hypothetical protein ABI448_13850, partial [Bacteroidia bacterium]